MDTCLVKDCASGRGVFSRGLCHPHYESCRLGVAKGLTTWEELEKAGAVAPARRGHRAEWWRPMVEPLRADPDIPPKPTKPKRA